jgi:hypothetical protein
MCSQVSEQGVQSVKWIRDPFIANPALDDYLNETFQARPKKLTLESLHCKPSR